MKVIFIAAATALLALPALAEGPPPAQQPPPSIAASAIDQDWQSMARAQAHVAEGILRLAAERDQLAKELKTAQAEIIKLKAENENLKAPPKAADKSKP